MLPRLVRVEVVLKSKQSRQSSNVQSRPRIVEYLLELRSSPPLGFGLSKGVELSEEPSLFQGASQEQDVLDSACQGSNFDLDLVSFDSRCLSIGVLDLDDGH